MEKVAEVIIPDLKKVVILAYGGAMSGTYAAGVFTFLEEHNFLPRTEALYGSSAGLQGCAYFLTGEAKLGSSIYWEDLSNDKYISWNNSLKFLSHILFGRTTKSHLSTKPLFDIQKFVKIEKYIKKLDLVKLIESKIPLYAIVYSISKNKHLEIPIHQNLSNLEEIMLASTGGQPGYPLTRKCLGNECLDGDLIFNYNLIDQVCEQYSDSNILCIISDPQPVVDGLAGKVPLLIQYFLNKKLYGKEIAKKSYDSKSTALNKNKYLKKYKNLSLLINPYKGEQVQTDPKKLKKIWKQGFKDMQKLFNNNF